LQVVEGRDGAKARGDSWPAFHKSTVHTSPLLYDFDSDNIQDILVATYDGDVLFFKDTVGSLSPKHRPHKFDIKQDILVATYGGDILFFKDTVGSFKPERKPYKFDTIHDIPVATYDGDILFFKDTVGSLNPRP